MEHRQHRLRLVYLGAVVDVGAVMETGEVICSPKYHTVHRIIEHVNEVAVSRSFPSGRASKLRGIAGWAGSHLCGKCGRLALRFLKDRQYDKSGCVDVDDVQMEELQHLASLA